MPFFPNLGKKSFKFHLRSLARSFLSQFPIKSISNFLLRVAPMSESRRKSGWRWIRRTLLRFFGIRLSCLTQRAVGINSFEPYFTPPDDSDTILCCNVERKKERAIQNVSSIGWIYSSFNLLQQKSRERATSRPVAQR